MKKIVLIACAAKKLNYKAKAKNLYISSLLKKNLAYARSLEPDKIFILSAKHGLLDLDEEIFPYNETLNEKSSYEIKIWANSVLQKLRINTNPDKDEFIFILLYLKKKNIIFIKSKE